MKTESGLEYTEIEVGAGAQAEAGKTVRVCKNITSQIAVFARQFYRRSNLLDSEGDCFAKRRSQRQI